MTHEAFLDSHEYRQSTESAKYVYQERIAILCDDRKPDFFAHEIALKQFREFVEEEKGIYDSRIQTRIQP